MRLLSVLILSSVNGVFCANKPHAMKIQDIRNSLALEVLTSTGSRNAVVAILPLQFMLCKLASVARGRAKEEIMKGMGFTDDKMITNFYSKFREMLELPLQSDLTFVNKIYMDYDNKINMKFAENAAVQYGVHVDSVSYNMPRAATNYINNRVATVTYRRVENVVNFTDINNLTSLLLITAGHFKPSWENNFNPELTRNRMFRLLENGRIEVPMMTKMAEYQYYDAKDFRVVTVRLASWGCSMTFVQPNFLALERVLEKMANYPDLMRDVRAQMTWKHLRLVLPRMKIKNQIDLDGFLKDGGIRQIFNTKSTDLNKILKNEVNVTSNMYVSKIRQKIFFEMDEFGLARIHREWNGPRAREPPNTLEVVFDRPFFFTVNLELSPTDVYELFNGVYYGPELSY